LDIGLHSLRHGAATLLRASGVPDSVAISLMGHADVRILRRYQKVLPELLSDAAAKMNQTLGG
jgi:integrase